MLVDDAFIHLRIARNYAISGHAFFNANERVMATSSPLWTILLTGLGVWKHLWFLSVIESLLLTLCGTLAYLLSAEISFDTSEAAADLDSSSRSTRTFLYHSIVAGLTMVILLPSSVGGMETPLAIALLLGAMRSAIGKRIWALPLLACAACTRLELTPLFAIVFVIALRARWPRRPLILAAAIGLSVSGWIFTQFGIALPNSMHAKSIGYGFHRMEIVRQIFAVDFVERPLGFCLLVFLVCICFQTVQALRHRKLHHAIWLPTLLGVWGLIVMLEYITRTNPIFEWYIPLIWVPILLFLLLNGRVKSSNLWLTVPVECIRLASLFLLLLAPVWKASMLVRAGWRLTPSAIAEEDRQDSARVQAYLVVGNTLRRSCPAGTLMTSEIGALGWSFRGHIDDAFGIASPRAIAFQPLRSGAEVAGIPAGYALEAAPDIIVSYSALDTEVRNSRELGVRYRRIALPTTLPADHVSSMPLGWHKSTHLDVLLRKNGLCSYKAIENALTGEFAPNASVPAFGVLN